MAWNEIAARDDPNLKLELYYLRVNVLGHMLSPHSVELFQMAWDTYSRTRLPGLLQSRMSGVIIADIIRALALDEINNVRAPESGWFVHSGATVYGPDEGSQRTATIVLENGDVLRSVVRKDSEITATASTNMKGVDDTSFIVGRILGGEKFDLVAAGYRNPAGEMLQRASRKLDAIHSVEASVQMSDSSTLFPSFKFAVPDENILSSTVSDLTKHFAYMIRSKGSWSILYDNGKPAHETRHQALFHNFSRISFNILGIMVHPGADHGSGQTDLTLTLGEATHIVEFKKDVSPGKVLHGLQVQLPRYMEAAEATKGTYIVACHTKDPDEVRAWIPQNRPEGVEVEIVDCRKRISASRA